MKKFPKLFKNPGTELFLIYFAIFVIVVVVAIYAGKRPWYEIAGIIFLMILVTRGNKLLEGD